MIQGSHKGKYTIFEWNENKTYQNMWDVANPLLKVKFMVLKTYIGKEEWSQINNIISALRHQNKERKLNPNQ